MAELADSQASSPVPASSPAPIPLTEMVSQAIAELVATCTKQDSWSLSCPNKLLQTALSSGKDFYVKPVGLLNEPLKHYVATTISEIGNGFKDMGKTKPGQASVLYNDTFWDQFFMSILFQIGGKLYNTYEQGQEVDLRRELLTPLLEKAAHCAASLTRSGLSTWKPLIMSSHITLRSRWRHGPRLDNQGVDESHNAIMHFRDVSMMRPSTSFPLRLRCEQLKYT